MLDSSRFKPLFRDGDLRDYLADRVAAGVDRAGRNMRSGQPREADVARAARRARVEPLVLADDSRVRRSSVREVHLPEDATNGGAPGEATAYRMEGYLPYEGDPGLWRCRPPGAPDDPLAAVVEPDRIVLEVVLPVDEATPDGFQVALQHQRARIDDRLALVAASVSAHNEGVEDAIRNGAARQAAAEQRLTRLEAGLDVRLSQHELAERVRQRFEVPVLVAALLVVPVIFVETQFTSPGWQAVAWWGNWAIWAVFFAEYAVVVWLTDHRWSYTKRAWLDVFIIVSSFPLLSSTLAATRLLRLVRVVRLLRVTRLAAVLARGGGAARTLFSRGGIGYLAILTLLLALGAGGLYALAEDLTSLGDGIWWAFVTLTTVGYGDTVPVTPFARVVGVLLMFVGIGFVAALTATVAARFIEEPADRGGEQP